jgi:hypothetical protein
MAKELQQSETRTIKRSQINLNPFNPKRHSDDEISRQLKNFKKVGYLGGIVWNEQTGNLVDGHRRVFAQDIFYKYGQEDGTDYSLKVEVCHFDEKTEKEQLTFMSMANGKPDFQLIAEYIGDIDFANAGLSEAEYKAILDFVPSEADISEQTIDLNDLVMNNAVFERPKTQYEQGGLSEEDRQRRIDEIKAVKHSDSNITEDSQDTNLIISFQNQEDKQVFLDYFGVFSQEKIVSGSVFLDVLAARGLV